MTRASIRTWTRLVAATAATVAVGWWIHSTRVEPHHLEANFQNGVLLSPGLAVTIAGVNVGRIDSVRLVTGHVLVRFGINAPDAWPLHRGTIATIRWGTTIGNGTRRIDLTPGPRTAAPIPDGGVVATTATSVPVEFDQLFDTFNARTRAAGQQLAQRGLAVLDGRGPALNDGIAQAPAGLGALNGVLTDLSANRSALAGLVASGDRATATLASRRAQVSAVVTVASRTLQAFANRSRDVSATLGELPSALSQLKATLARLDTSAGGLTALLVDLRPGAALLPELGARLHSALGHLSAIARPLAATVKATIAGGAAITAFLGAAAPFLGRQLAPALRRLTPMVACLSPYAPETAGFLSNWASATQYYDQGGHYGRFHIIEGPTSMIGSPLSAAQAAALPGMVYAPARPPGFDAGQPWFQPQCGLGHGGSR